MSTATLIIGRSGTGKSHSLKNLNPADVLLIQVMQKPLPFKDGKHWRLFVKDQQPAGNVIVTEDFSRIIKLMRGTARKIIVIDDFQYLLANEFMNRSDETGYQKFTDIAKHAWEVIGAASKLDGNKRVYFLSHSEDSGDGLTKMKTIGKMLDEKITPEGMFTIVLKTLVDGDNYYFTTRNSGTDVVKSPSELFDDAKIPNDLKYVDDQITEYYGINEPKPEADDGEQENTDA